MRGATPRGPFAFQQVPARSPPKRQPRIGDRTGEPAVVDHPAQVQRLGDDGLVLVHQPPGHVVQEVRPGIGHAGVQARHPLALGAPAPGAEIPLERTPLCGAWIAPVTVRSGNR